jgi:toxin ParE1/3/4
MRRGWTVRVGQHAEQDLAQILQWTLKTFGKDQASLYAETLVLAIAALEDGPDVLGAKKRDDIQPGIRTLHVAREGRAGRHFVMFRAVGSCIDVLRLLHDGMDLPRHWPLSTEPES